MYIEDATITGKTNDYEEKAIRKPTKEIYVAVDACAELGGQPYKVLESLQKTYKITGMGKHSKDGVTPATPSAEFEAVGAMINASPNKRLTDVFIVSLDQKELATLSDQDGIADDISIKMPDGATREILKKFSPSNGSAAQIRDLLGLFNELCKLS